MTDTTQRAGSTLSGAVSQLPLDRLKKEARSLGQAVTESALSRAGERVDSLTGKLNDYAEGTAAPKALKNVAEGDSPAKAGVKAGASKLTDKVKGAVDKVTGGGGGAGSKLKVTNILESIDVPVSRDVAYRRWTEFEDFPTFTKKVENVKQEEPEKLTWKAQIFWSHRAWDAEIIDQVPPERIVWKSEGEKGHVDGAVTFHELSPDLTRILMTLEYHPKGFFEHVGNIWRAQGRRARLELKHFARHVSTHTLVNQEDVEGWTGEIHDGEVTKEPETEADEKERSTSGGQSAKSKGSTKGNGSANENGSTKRSGSAKAGSGQRGQKKPPSKASGSSQKAKRPARKSQKQSAG